MQREGWKLCKSDCFEGHALHYDPSAEFSEKQKLETDRAWRSPVRFSVCPPAVQKEPDFHPPYRCLADCTGNLLQNPRDPSPSESVLEGPRAFYYYIISILFVINQDHYFLSSRCSCGEQTTIIPFIASSKLWDMPCPSPAQSPFSQAKQIQSLQLLSTVYISKASYSLFWN